MRTNLIKLALGAGLVVCAMPASAQVCTSDDQCAQGSWCEPAGRGDSDCSPGAECDPPSTDPGAPDAPTDDPDAPDSPPVDPVPTEGTCTPLPEGVCESIADCTAGLECVKGESTAPCAPGAACDDAPSVSRYGRCDLPEMPCTTDAQCLAGLTCVDDGGSDVSCPSEEGPCPEPSDDASKVCSFEPKLCTADAECGANYECAAVGDSTSCSGGGSSGVDCAEGQSCDAGAPVPSDDDCTTTMLKACFPKKTPCTSDAQCPADWVCFAFSDKAGGVETPDWWNDTGDVQRCLPKGVALVAATERNSDGDGEGSSDGDDTGTGAPGGEASETPVALKGDGKGNGLCTLSVPGSRASAFVAWFGLGLGLLVARRRRSR